MVFEHYDWHFDYVRLAVDEGFTFRKQKNETQEKNRICVIDVEKTIREGDIAIVEQCIPAIVNFSLDVEQTTLLDATFVKHFRVSQLVVEYLLFCKKYLDHTVVLLKRELAQYKEENREQKIFIDELKNHVAALVTKVKEQSNAGYRCVECKKVFSTEDFLNAHKARRHSNSVCSDTPAEADKLQMEIKELKGRLNSAEKLISESSKEDFNKTSCHNDSKVVELEKNFENLKVAVESELMVMRNQRQLEGRCERILEVPTKNLQNVEMPRLLEEKNVGTENFSRIRETMTQTENFEDGEQSRDAQKSKEAYKDIDMKVTSKLQLIEHQMQSFLNKLSNIQLSQKLENVVEQSIGKPVAKPRTRYTITTANEPENTTVTEPDPLPLQHADDNYVVQKLSGQPVLKRKQAEETNSLQNIENKSHSASRHNVNTDSEISDKQLEQQPSEKSSSPIPVMRKRSETNLKKLLDQDILTYFKNDVENIVFKRLQDIGISHQWKGIPQKSFNRAMEIVNHQANLAQKNQPQFFKIRHKLQKDVSKQAEQEKKHAKRLKSHAGKLKDKPFNVAVKSKLMNKPLNMTKVEIKNRHMYDTDSESEEVDKHMKEMKRFTNTHQSNAHSAVVTKLKTLNKNVDVDLDGAMKKECNNNKTQMNNMVTKKKCALPQTTANKKKVFFDLNSQENIVIKKANNINESTTSIASSVLDASLNNDIVMKSSKKDIEDLSDFDFNEIC